MWEISLVPTIPEAGCMLGSIHHKVEIIDIYQSLLDVDTTNTRWQIVGGDRQPGEVHNIPGLVVA